MLGLVQQASTGPTLHQRLSIQEAEAVHVVLQGPVAQGSQHQRAHDCMPAGQYAPCSVVQGGVQASQGQDEPIILSALSCEAKLHLCREWLRVSWPAVQRVCCRVAALTGAAAGLALGLPERQPYQCQAIAYRSLTGLAQLHSTRSHADSQQSVSARHA